MLMLVKVLAVLRRASRLDHHPSGKLVGRKGGLDVRILGVLGAALAGGGTWGGKLQQKEAA